MARLGTLFRVDLRGLLAVGLLVTLALAAAACSASGGTTTNAPTQAPSVAGATPVPAATTGSSASSSQAPASGTTQEVQVTLSEFTIGLSSTSLKAGRVRFNVSNPGKFTHAFEIAGQGMDKKTANLNAGQSDMLEVDLAPGKYEVWCPVGNHKDRGMDTNITVQ